MRIAILDPAAGISGDMLLGALIDAGAPTAWLEGLPARLGFRDVRMRVRKVQRTSLAATKVDVELPGGVTATDEHHTADAAHGRHVGELMALVRRAPLSAAVRDRALRAFELIGTAEARVHGTTPERVHLHEVGAIDAVLDIVGGIEGFERLGVGTVYNLPVATGTGWVSTAHGRLPVPAPATGVLLEGVAVATGGPVEGEATTPTGAALLRVLSQGQPPSAWRVVGSGWGAGERDPAAYPNALRLLLAEAADEAGVIEVLATDLDDLSPEYVEPLRAAVLAAGAVECLAWPVYGKKGRAAIRVEVLVAAERADQVVEALFRHSPTAGVRRSTTTRVTLPRREEIVELQAGVRVRIKVWEGPDGPRLKAEYDDVLMAADRLGVPAWRLARDVERQATAQVIEGRTNNQRNQERT